MSSKESWYQAPDGKFFKSMGAARGVIAMQSDDGELRTISWEELKAWKPVDRTLQNKAKEWGFKYRDSIDDPDESNK